MNALFIFLFILPTVSYGLYTNLRCPDGSEIPAWYFCQRARVCADIGWMKRVAGGDPGKKQSKTHPGKPGSDSGPPGSDLGSLDSNSVPPGSDSGPPGSDSGLPGSDSGLPDSDSRPPGSKSGPPGSDSGPFGSDSGPPGSDPGSLDSNSGPPGSDSGPPGSDSGLPDSDSGPPGSDSGPPGSDPDESADPSGKETEIVTSATYLQQDPDLLPDTGYYSDDYSGSGDTGDHSDTTRDNTEITQTPLTQYINCEMKQCSVNVSLSDAKFCLNTPPCHLMDPNYFKCGNERCMERSTICDGDICNDCPEVDDWPNGIGFKCFRNKTLCKLPQQLLYDEVHDCDDAVDMCFPLSDLVITNKKPSSPMDASRCFECMSGDMIIQRIQVCDGVFDCRDLSDECLCEDAPSVCEEVGMYRPLSDVTSFGNPCGFKELNCGNGTCVPAFEVMCNSISECSNNRDEKYEYCHGTLRCGNGLESDVGNLCRCLSRDFISCKNNEATLCNLIDECPLEGGYWFPQPGYPADECEAKCPNKTEFGCILGGIIGNALGVTGIQGYKCNMTEIVNGSTTTAMTVVNDNQVCDGTLTCTADHFDENKQKCKNRFFCPSLGLVNIDISKKCDGIEDCDDGSDEWNTTCPSRFFCKANRGKKVSIAPSRQCDYVIDCDNQEDEMNCDDGRFYCEDHKPLFVLKSQTFNGIQDCEDWSDECPTIPVEGHDDIFSSRYELIANPILRTLVWIMGLMAIAGNSVVGFFEIKNLFKLRNKRASASVKANHILVLNLAISDLLMGLYLILLGGYGLKFAGRFCTVSFQWLTSQTCDILGILSVLSSESSVMTLALLTAFRLHSILNPFKSSLKPKLSVVISSLLLTWAISFTLALMPISRHLQGLFVENAFISGNPFFHYPKVPFDVAKKYVIKLFTFGGNVTSSLDYDTILAASAWKDLPIVKPRRFFGYYSSQSVCLFKIFVTTNDKSWIFSIILASFNFVCFMFVCVAYVMIIYSTKRGKSIRNQSKRSKDKRQNNLQKKIIRLIVTDFCCWVPITIMAFINFTLYELPAVCYAVAAIVLLPINSALNPILYSNAIDNLVAFMKKKRSQRNPTDNSSSLKTKSTNISSMSR